MSTLRRCLTFLSLILIMMICMSCATGNGTPKTGSTKIRLNKHKLSPYVIQPNDELDIKFYFNKELNETVRVRPDGKISLQLVDEIHASGMQPSELDTLLTQKYARELQDPQITVIVKSFSAHHVYVGGEVYKKGIVVLTNGMTPLQAVISAGGVLETADGNETLIIRKGHDNRPVPIKVNLSQYSQKKGSVRDVVLRPNDIVYVPKSGIANVNKFISQYIRGLLLFQGWDFSVGYDLDNRR